uniref:Uncharacterized protein n=1 Tax=Stomoxys calcitrans TaxID=35570 RepID=A0A1I8PI71_STOCA
MNFLITSQVAAKERNFNVECRQTLCKAINPQIIKRFECSAKKIGPSSHLGNSVFMFNQQLDTNFDMHLKIHVGTGGKIVKFLDLKMNVCETLFRGMSIPLVKKIMIDVLKSSNIPRKCPFKANFLYNMSDLIVDDSYFPKFTPTPMDLNFSIDYLENQKKFAILRIEAATVPKTP